MFLSRVARTFPASLAFWKYRRALQHHSLAWGQGRSGLVVSPGDAFSFPLSFLGCPHIACLWLWWLVSSGWAPSKAIPIRLCFRTLGRCCWGKALPFLLDVKVRDVRFGAANDILQPQEKRANVEERRAERQKNQRLAMSFEPTAEPRPWSKPYLCYMSW